MFRGYFPVTAQDQAAARRRRGGKIMRQPDLARYVVDRLVAAWSPEQMAGFLRRNSRDGLRVSHETIYQYVYGPEGLGVKRSEDLTPWAK